MDFMGSRCWPPLFSRIGLPTIRDRGSEREGGGGGRKRGRGRRLWNKWYLRCNLV